MEEEPEYEDNIEELGSQFGEKMMNGSVVSYQDKALCNCNPVLLLNSYQSKLFE